MAAVWWALAPPERSSSRTLRFSVALGLIVLQSTRIPLLSASLLVHGGLFAR